MIPELLVIHFYSAAEYSIQRTKELIELHYNFRNDAPEFFTGKGYRPPQYSHNEWDITYVPRNVCRYLRSCRPHLSVFSAIKFSFIQISNLSPLYTYLPSFRYLCDFPHHTKEGYRLVYCGFKDYDSSKFNLKVGLAVFVKCLLAVIYDRGTCDGYGFVFDMQGVTIGHLSTFTISLAQKFLFFAQVSGEDLKRVYTYRKTRSFIVILSRLRKRYRSK